MSLQDVVINMAKASSFQDLTETEKNIRYWGLRNAVMCKSEGEDVSEISMDGIPPGMFVKGKSYGLIKDNCADRECGFAATLITKDKQEQISLTIRRN